MRHAAEFQRIFGVPLNWFWDRITGFNVVEFDKWIEAGERSLHDAVMMKYSASAAHFITVLCKMKGETTQAILDRA